MESSESESDMLDTCGTKHGGELHRLLGRLLLNVTKFSLTGRLRILPALDDLESDMSPAIASGR
jgi:hypothetical protein